MALTQLGSKALMSIIKIKENGTYQDFYAVRHDAYAAGRTLLLRRYTHSDRQWHSSNVNAYATCTLDTWFNTDYLTSLPAEVQDAITEVSIPYTIGNNNWTVSSLSRKVFALSGTELGQSHQYMKVEGTALANASTLKIATDSSGTAKVQWTRSPSTNNTTYAWYLSTSGTLNNYFCSNAYGVRPAFTLPSTLSVDENGYIVFNQPPGPVPSINVPNTAVSTQQINVSWTAATDPEGDALTYILERAFNGGGFTQVSAAAGLTFAETVSVNWDSIQYRVKARDSFGNESAYTTSNTVTVIHNQPPVISGQDGDLGIKVEGFSYRYTVTDPDADTVTVTEAVDGAQFRSYTVVLGQENSADVVGNVFLDLSFDQHTLTITATDTSGNAAVRQMTFTKQVDGLSVELAEPMEATAQPRRANIRVTRQIAAGATFKVEATNNPYDAVPVWEDCTNAVLSNHAHVFSNNVNAAPRYGMNIRVEVKRKKAISECWVSGIEGNFE